MLSDKKPRGFAQEMTSYDEDVTVVKWLDNKITHLASNFVGIGEKDLVKRWCKNKHFIEAERPERLYNTDIYEAALPNDAYCFAWSEVNGKR
ncbi:unnamed protein product [Leptidea sinapis]|uniref:Uncharacterized protein n=1 Tax=Leptidea sinapis TaxID=189913 RepID=A0A5E4PN32_9NEOP|nr:unnamed protein product [Leptidea sinapis]